MTGEIYTYISDFGSVPITKEQLERYDALSVDERQAFDRRQMKHLGEHWAAGAKIETLSLVD